MTLIVKVQEFDEPKPIPEGLYEAYVKELSEEEGEFGQYVKISFVITTEAQRDEMRTMIASKKLSKSKKSGKVSKLYGIVKSLTGKEPDKDSDFNLQDLKGKPCKIIVKNDKEVEGVMYQKISDVLPL
ncbi:hypothetical protein HY029_02840 [Candidatus Gottesmanbacteria bacterium]|nr:hypothetical protein [Candidatus Gottesmanbacteria bacterium]